MDISSSSRMVNVIHIETFSFKPPYPGALQKKSDLFKANNNNVINTDEINT